jgi:uncharacterized membrane protein (UPF0127 family)
LTRYVRIEDATRNTVVAERCRVAESHVHRIFGLHLLPRLENGEGLLLRGSTTIDTTFMSYPIDLVFVGRSGRVTRTVHRLAPWRMVVRTGGGRDCIELPAGAVAESGVQAGDELTFTPLS